MTLTPGPQGCPALVCLTLHETFRPFFLVLFFSYPCDGKCFSSNDSGRGDVGGTFEKETNRIDFARSVPTWVFFPLKAQQAESINFNYIDLQLLTVVALSLASLGGKL